jgi:hypothetical protein
MKALIFSLACWVGFTLPHAQAAAPKINVGSMFDYIDSDKGTLLKRIRNAGDATAFVRVEISEIVYGEDGKPSEQAVENSRLGADKDGLVASPARMIIPANSQQSTRLVYSGGRSRERYYRVRYVPAVPETSDDFALSPQERSEYAKELSAGVTVMTGFGTIIIVHPTNAHYATRHENDAAGYTVRNEGNSTVVLDDFKACDAKGANCLPARKIHLLPGRSETFSKTEQQTYQFKLIEGNHEKPIRLAAE